MDYIHGWMNGMTTGNGQLGTVIGVLVVIALVVIIIKVLRK